MSAGEPQLPPPTPVNSILFILKPLVPPVFVYLICTVVLVIGPKLKL